MVTSARGLGFGGTSGKIPSKPGLVGKIEDAMKHGTGGYAPIDDALSAGGHSGNGSPQSTGSLVNPSGGLIPKGSSGSSGSRSRRRSGSSGSYVDYGGSPAPTSARRNWNYYESPIAKKYGFGRATAYQEALSNTAYRREMDDMRKAGLNPSVIYGSHSTSGASSNIYPRDDSSGGYGGYGGSGGSRRSYGRGNSGKYAFSGAAYYGIMAAAGAVTAVATGNVGAGMAAAGLVGTGLKALNGLLKG